MDLVKQHKTLKRSTKNNVALKIETDILKHVSINR